MISSRLVSIAILLALSSIEARAQAIPTAFPETPIEALRQLSLVLNQVRERFSIDNEARETIRSMSTDVTWLERNAPAWRPSESTAGFSRSIAYTTALLQSLLDRVRTDVKPVLDIARRDLRIHFLQCRAMGGPTTVQVRVRTRDGSSKEVGGYEVWYVRKAFENVPAAFRRFEQNSSPTERSFREAGFYVLWVEHTVPSGLKRRGTRLDFEIGLDQTTRIDLATP